MKRAESVEGARECDIVCTESFRLVLQEPQIGVSCFAVIALGNVDLGQVIQRSTDPWIVGRQEPLSDLQCSLRQLQCIVVLTVIEELHHGVAQLGSFLEFGRFLCS